MIGTHFYRVGNKVCIMHKIPQRYIMHSLKQAAILRHVDHVQRNKMESRSTHICPTGIGVGQDNMSKAQPCTKPNMQMC